MSTSAKPPCGSSSASTSRSRELSARGKPTAGNLLGCLSSCFVPLGAGGREVDLERSYWRGVDRLDADAVADLDELIESLASILTSAEELRARLDGPSLRRFQERDLADRAIPHGQPAGSPGR